MIIFKKNNQKSVKKFGDKDFNSLSLNYQMTDISYQDTKIGQEKVLICQLSVGLSKSHLLMSKKGVRCIPFFVMLKTLYFADQIIP